MALLDDMWCWFNQRSQCTCKCTRKYVSRLLQSCCV